MDIDADLLGDGLFEHVGVDCDVQVDVYVALEVQVSLGLAEGGAVVFVALLDGYSEACEVDPSAAVVCRLLPFSLHREDSMIGHLLLALLQQLALLPRIKLMLLDHQDLLIAAMADLHSVLGCQLYFSLTEQQLVTQSFVIGHELDVVTGGEFAFLGVEEVEAESVGVESSGLVDLGPAVDAEVQLVLTVVDLHL